MQLRLVLNMHAVAGFNLAKANKVALKPASGRGDAHKYEMVFDEQRGGKAPKERRRSRTPPRHRSRSPRRHDDRGREKERDRERERDRDRDRERARHGSRRY